MKPDNEILTWLKRLGIAESVQLTEFAQTDGNKDYAGVAMDIGLELQNWFLAHPNAEDCGGEYDNGNGTIRRGQEQELFNLAKVFSTKGEEAGFNFMYSRISSNIMALICDEWEAEGLPDLHDKYAN